MQPISKIVDGRRVIVKKPELLAPAGNLEKLKTAIIYGADAYLLVVRNSPYDHRHLTSLSKILKKQYNLRINMVLKSMLHVISSFIMIT